MSILDAINSMDQYKSFTEGSYDPETHQPQYIPQATTQEMYNLYRTQPMSTAIGYISPYPSNNWHTTSEVLNYVDDTSRLPAIDQKIDPNRIFTSDIAALRALAADQNKITKMFEKRLVESLADKGKFGLTEEDVIAMQAVTAARNAIATINRDQITIKKHIADLKIKQQQLNGAGNGGNMQNGIAVENAMDAGRSFMDRIFDIPTVPVDMSKYTPDVVDVDQASEILDNIIPDVGQATTYESQHPKTYVVVGDNDREASYETYSSDGQLLSDYPNPTTPIKSIDRDSGKAVNERDEIFDIKIKNE